jgi:hypothetical protein
MVAVFGLFTVEGIALPACPMHGAAAATAADDRHAAPSAQAADASRHAADHHGHATPATDARALTPDGDAPAHDESAHGSTCDCLGACAVVAAFAPSPARMRSVATVVVTTPAEPSTETEPAAASGGHRLPYAIPPPAVVIG